jgi:hypothetical protein
MAILTQNIAIYSEKNNTGFKDNRHFFQKIGEIFRKC